jgi:hypothetical protein
MGFACDCRGASSTPGRRDISPDLGRRSPIHLGEDGVETTEAAETCPKCYLSHRQIGIVEQSLCALYTGGLGDLRRGRAEMP